MPLTIQVRVLLHSYDYAVIPQLRTTGSSAATKSYNNTAVASVAQRISPTPQPVRRKILAMIANTMVKSHVDHGLPALKIVKFHGSPENYPMFRQSFYQMAESKALDELTKVARLLQFLEGPRY